MRQIIFRGKRIDNGEWVYGFFGQHTSLDAMIIDRPYITSQNDISALAFWVVDPYTIGQYTGLKDKNGKRIFEGDMISRWNVVEFCNGEFCINGDTPLGVIAGNCEVIGNIYDNKEFDAQNGKEKEE